MEKQTTIRQRRYRKNLALKLERADRMAAGHAAIVEALAGNDKPLAVKLRAIAQEALK